MLGRLQHWRGTSQHRIRIFQFGRGIHRAADFTGIAVLVFRTALWTFALDIAVRQKHVLYRIEKLLDCLGGDEIRRFQLAVNVL